MADYIASVEGRFDNQVSSGADAATASLNRVADAADGATVSLSKAGPSASALANKYDEVTRANRAVTAAMRDQTAAAAALNRAQASGVGDAEALSRAYDAVSAKVMRLRAAQRGAVVAAAETPAALKSASAAMEEAATHGSNFAGVNHAITRELIVMGHEAMMGNFSRIPGSFMVLAEHGDSLLPTLGAIGSKFIGIGTLGAAGALTAAAGLGMMAYHAAEADAQLLRLRTSLSGTRDDWSAAAKEVMDGSRAFAQNTPGVTRAEAQTASQSIVAVPEFHGSTQALNAYLVVANDLAHVMGTKLPEAAQAMALSLANPDAAAKKATEEGLKGFNVALDEQVRHLQASGDLAGAQAAVLSAYQASVAGAAEHTTQLGGALEQLGHAWHGATDGAFSFAHELGGYVNDGIVAYLNYITALLNGLKAIEHFVSIGNGTAAGPTGFSGSALPLPASTQAFMPTIDHVAQETGLDSSLLARLQAFENPHQNKDGSWPVSPTGATGPFQVLPSTFALMRGKPSEYPLTAATDGNLNNPQTSSTAAGELMKHLLQKYHDPYTAILAYHDGEPVIDAVLNNGNGPGNSYVSKEALQEANTVTAGYRGTGFGLLSTAGNSTHSDGQAGTAGASLGTSGLNNAVMANAQSAYERMNTLGGRQEANQETQSALEKGIQLASLEGDTATVAKYTDALNQARGASTDLISEQDKLARAAAESSAVLAQQSPVLRDLATIRQKFTDAARSSGQGVNEADVGVAQAAELAKLSDQHTQSVQVVERDTAAQHQLAAAYEDQSGSAQHVQDVIKATDDARATAAPGSAEEARQIEETTKALDDNAAARADVQTAQQNQSSQNSIAMLQAEISALHESTAARTADLAAIKTRQEILSRGGDPNSDVSQKAVSNAQEVGALTDELDRQKASMAALGQIGDQVFNDLGQSISQAFVAGQGHAVNFKNIVESVLADVETQLVKLALVNPLENLFTGSNNPTATSVFGGSGSGGGVFGGLLGAANSSGSLDGIKSYLGIGSSTASAGSSLLDGGNTGWVDMGGAASAGSGSAGGSSLSGLMGAGGTALGTIGSFYSASQAGDNTTGSKKTDTRIGAYAGAAIGTAIMPGVGSIVGEMIGQLIGGMLGSVQHNGWNIKVGTTPDGMLTTTNSGFEGTSKDNSAAALAQAAYDEAKVNLLLNQYDAKASGSTLYGGDNGPGGVNLVGQATTFEEAMGKLVYSSTDAIIEQALQTYGAAGTLNSINNLAIVLANAKSLSDAATNLSSPIVTSGSGNFLTTNYTGLGGSIASQSASLWTNTYAPQLNEANVIGNKGLYDQLLAGFNQVVQRLNDQATYQVNQTDAGYVAATQTANGQNTAAANTAFQSSADQQRQALQQELDGLYGTAYESTQAYADQFALLNSTIAAQAAALQRQQQQQLTTDLIGVQSNNLSWQASGASALGNTNLASQLSLQASQMTQMNQTVDGLTALLQNGEIDQTAYNQQIQALTLAQAQETQGLNQQQILANQTSQDTYNGNTLSFEARTLTAQGGQGEQAAIDNFDAQAATQVDQLTGQLQGMLSNGVISTEQYYSQITQLDQTLAAERLAIQQQYVDQANSQITGQVSSLTGFLQGLESEIGTPEDQLKATAATYNSDLAASKGGDATAFANLQGDASAYLAASKSANGAGTTAYINDLEAVISGIGSITSSTSTMSALTTSTMSSIAETQTEKLLDGISQMKAEIVKLQTQLQQATLSP